MIPSASDYFQPHAEYGLLERYDAISIQYTIVECRRSDNLGVIYQILFFQSEERAGLLADFKRHSEQTAWSIIWLRGGVRTLVSKFKKCGKAIAEPKELIRMEKEH